MIFSLLIDSVWNILFLDLRKHFFDQEKTNTNDILNHTPILNAIFVLAI